MQVTNGGRGVPCRAAVWAIVSATPRTWRRRRRPHQRRLQPDPEFAKRKKESATAVAAAAAAAGAARSRIARANGRQSRLTRLCRAAVWAIVSATSPYLAPAPPTSTAPAPAGAGIR
jgi:hypothetical protein